MGHISPFHLQPIFDQKLRPLGNRDFVGMASLKGLADEWDSCTHVRERVRLHNRLFLKEPGKEEVLPTITCAQINYHILRPLVERLEQSPGVLGMHSLPDIKKQNLVKFMQSFLLWLMRLPDLSVGLALLRDNCSFSDSTLLRIKAFYVKFQAPVPNRKELNSEAKAAKKFMVLVKAKLNRGQNCRTVLFRKLLAAAFASTRSKAKDYVGNQNEQRFVSIWVHSLLTFSHRMGKLMLPHVIASGFDQLSFIQC